MGTKNQNGTSSSAPEIRAVVRSVESGFVVTYVTGDNKPKELTEKDTITFSFSDWQGDQLPRQNQEVMLGSVSKFTRGWRALSARPITLENKQKGV